MENHAIGGKNHQPDFSTLDISRKTNNLIGPKSSKKLQHLNVKRFGDKTTSMHELIKLNPLNN